VSDLAASASTTSCFHEGELAVPRRAGVLDAMQLPDLTMCGADHEATLGSRNQRADEQPQRGGLMTAGGSGAREQNPTIFQKALALNDFTAPAGAGSTRWARPDVWQVR
jgi:hypothetical protein